MMHLSLRRKTPGAFTLVELMVATVVLIIILLMLVAMVNQTATIWRTSSAKIEQFRSARTAYESITRHLSQATLNTYYDYYYDPTTNVPLKYIRQSDLRFVVGPTQAPGGGAALVVPSSQTDHQPKPGPGHAIFFNAPLGFVSDDQTQLDATRNPPSSIYTGMENLLNSWGYFIEYGSDYNDRPAFLNTAKGDFTPPAERYRYRLMEMMVPSDQITIYRYTSDKAGNNAHYYDYYWFQQFLTLPITSTQASSTQQLRPAHLLAENIATLVIYPQLSKADQTALQNNSPPTSPYLAPGYTYDSTPVQGDPTAAANLHNPATDPTNQLPPVVQVTMVAIDEASAARAERQKKNGADQPPGDLNTSLTTYFQADPMKTGAPSQSALNYDTDLKSLQSDLVNQKITYRVFTSNVSLRGAKWSRD